MSEPGDAGTPRPEVRSESEEAVIQTNSATMSESNQATTSKQPVNAAGASNDANGANSAKDDDEAGATPSKISLRVVDQHNNEVFFNVKMTTKFGKVMGAYCQRQGLDPGSVRFLHDGERIVETQTPDDREMIDGDTIQVVLQQLGGDGSETL